jgi:hypothetical protein
MEEQLIPGDTRKPAAGYLTYAGGIEDPLPTIPMGPNTLGEKIWPVTIERFDDQTRIGFSNVAPSLDLIERSVIKYERG